MTIPANLYVKVTIKNTSVSKTLTDYYHLIYDNKNWSLVKDDSIRKLLLKQRELDPSMKGPATAQSSRWDAQSSRTASSVAITQAKPSFWGNLPQTNPKVISYTPKRGLYREFYKWVENVLIGNPVRMINQTFYVRTCNLDRSYLPPYGYQVISPYVPMPKYPAAFRIPYNKSLCDALCDAFRGIYNKLWEMFKELMAVTQAVYMSEMVGFVLQYCDQTSEKNVIQRLELLNPVIDAIEPRAGMIGELMKEIKNRIRAVRDDVITAYFIEKKFKRAELKSAYDYCKERTTLLTGDVAATMPRNVEIATPALMDPDTAVEKRLHYYTKVHEDIVHSLGDMCLAMSKFLAQLSGPSDANVQQLKLLAGYIKSAADFIERIDLSSFPRVNQVPKNPRNVYRGAMIVKSIVQEIS